MKSYTKYMDSISVDDELHKKIMKRVTQKPIPLYRNRTVYCFAGLAACAAVLLVCVLYVPNPLINPNNPDNSVILISPSGKNPATANLPTTSNSATPDNTFRPLPSLNIAVNEISEPVAKKGMMFNLGERTPMTYEEMMEYYGVSLPIANVLPALRLREDPYGVYFPENGSASIYDQNWFLFANEDVSQGFTVILAKEFVFFYEPSLDDVTALAFTNINGRELSIFRYIDSEGNDCYHAEFTQNGIAYCVLTVNLSQDDFIKGLSALVEDAVETKGNHTIIGTALAIDSYACRIGVRTDDGVSYSIYLPQGEAEKYSLYQRVEVVFSGEPATVGQIWRQQLISITIVGD